MKSFKEHFGRALAAAPDRLHFAAHSHHLWPDASFDAQVRAWEDAVRLADTKWEHVFGVVRPRAAARVAEVLGLPDPETLVFAPSTHELVMRIVSCMPVDRPLRFLTSDGEFHSFRRQWTRLAEAGRAEVDVVPVEPFETFPERFVDAIGEGDHDLVYVSHVMFDSGYVIEDLASIVGAVPEPAEVVVDGYHGFMALPVGLEAIAGRAFYVTGGYKYAMSGEGACFMHCPPGRCPRPVNTGWFAGFGHLTGDQRGQVPYAGDGSRFAGATYDPTGLYRLDAVLELWARLGVQVADIHAHVRALQDRFLDGVDEAGSGRLRRAQLLPPEALARGHFLAFRTPEAGVLHERLLRAGIFTDYRNDRLRFGFGIYQDPADVDALLARMPSAIA